MNVQMANYDRNYQILSNRTLGNLIKVHNFFFPILPLDLSSCRLGTIPVSLGWSLRCLSKVQANCKFLSSRFLLFRVSSIHSGCKLNMTQIESNFTFLRLEKALYVLFDYLSYFLDSNHSRCKGGFFVFFSAIPPKASAERHGSGKRELILYQNLSH